jgi:hypothetical protein
MSQSRHSSKASPVLDTGAGKSRVKSVPGKVVQECHSEGVKRLKNLGEERRVKLEAPPTDILRGIYPECSVRTQDDSYAFSDNL